MKRFFDLHEHLANLRHLFLWSLMALPPAIVAGSASAFFLWALEAVTHLRWEHPWLLWLLPIGGLVVGLAYHWYGKEAERGNNLIMDEIHQPGGGVPVKMAPLVLFGTLMTHLFGGSAGREGTAVQMGGAIASGFAKLFKLKPETKRILLMCGVAAGFGSVFGTPLAGAVFAMEVLAIGFMRYEALVPVLIASVAGDFTCAAWGIHHTVYKIEFAEFNDPHGWFRLDLLLLAKVTAAALCFGLASMLFSEAAHAIQRPIKSYLKFPPLRLVIGGLAVIAMTYAVGTRDYLGIGVSNPDPTVVTIVSSFSAGGAHPYSWLLKLAFTVVTLGFGFKGGEVTPLFFIGATLGNTLALIFHAPVDLFAGLGFIAVFAGAANTPLACTLMGIELFGAGNTVYFAVACFIAYFFSGQTGIYSAQKRELSKRT